MKEINKYQLVIDKLNSLKSHRVLVACSTGVDSMVLLHAVEDAKIDLGVVHINHSKREQSNIEESFIREYCLNNNIPFYFKKLEEYHGSNFQEWARNERYNFFYDVMLNNNYDYLLLAHHADDNLETVLMRFFKKSSLKGLSGIRENTSIMFNNKEINIFRPLLSLTKEDIYNIAKKNNYKYFEDSSNQSDDYDRNKIRHNLIPLLKEFNPNIYDCLKEYSYNLSESSDIIENITKEYILNNVKEYKHTSYVLKVLSYESYSKLNKYIQREVIFTLLRKMDLSIKTINEILESLNKNKVIIPILNKGYIIKEYGFIKLMIGNLEESNELLIEKEGTYNLNSEISMNIINSNNNNNERIKKIWYNSKVIYVNSLPVIIRKKEPKDKIVLNSGTVTVSNLLTNKKINYLDRENTYCIISEKNSNNVDQLLIYNQEEVK